MNAIKIADDVRYQKYGDGFILTGHFVYYPYKLVVYDSYCDFTTLGGTLIRRISKHDTTTDLVEYFKSLKE